MFLFWRNRLIKAALVALFCYALACQIAVPIHLTSVDIGRHLKNGALVLSGRFDVLYHNLYSFTYPDYPFINHHWLGGVIFELVHRLVGWPGLSLFYILILLSGYLFFYKTARLYASFGLVMAASTVAMVIMAERREIRPEGFSVLFMGIYFYTLELFQRRKLTPAFLLAVLVPIQILWVNIHIFFFVGPLLALCYALYYRRGWGVVAAVALANLVNPSFVQGAITPFNGFKGFGYNLAENQTVWFMIKRFAEYPIYKYEAVLLCLGVAALIGWLIKNGRALWPVGIFYALMLVAGFKAVRLMPPVAFIWVVLTAQALGQRKGWSVPLACLSGALLAVVVLFPSWLAPLPVKNSISLGLSPGVNLSAEFFKAVHLKGPMFSNYDIGGYLIYHLYPEEKVFVDNRQEAFPQRFFKDVYVPMQENESEWTKQMAIHHFEVIYFYRHDLTPWGQNFLINRVEDPQWAPIFVDSSTIIFARRGGVNQPAIDRYELPRGMFGVKKPAE